MVSVPLLAPVVVGVKVTLIEQEVSAARLALQVLVWEKSPLMAILVIVRVELPVFRRLTLCAMLLEPTACAAKVREVEETTADVATPFPVRLTVWGEEPALSVIVSEPLRAPVVEGVKVTLIEQETPAARLGPQVLVWEKFPLTVMLEMAKAALPLLVRVITSGVLEVPTSWFPKT
jgi:hypothetical protein